MADEKKETALARQVEGMSLEGMAQHFLKSGYFHDVSDASKAVVKIMAGREVGIPPVAAMMGLYIIEGKVTYSATMVGALIKTAGYKYTVQWNENNGGTCLLNFRDKDGTNLGVSSFSMMDAKAAGLAGKNTWAKFPRAMLFARALTQGGRWYCPEVFAGGCYTPEELAPNTAVNEDGEIVDAAKTNNKTDALATRRAQMIEAFGKEGVTETALVDFCGCALEELTAANFDTLKDIWRDVREGKRDKTLADVGKNPPPAGADDLDAGQRERAPVGTANPPSAAPAPAAPGASDHSRLGHMTDEALHAHLDRLKNNMGVKTYDDKIASIVRDCAHWDRFSDRDRMEWIADELRTPKKDAK